MSPTRFSEQDALREELEDLRQEIHVLRSAVDDLTEALRWQNNNAEEYPDLVTDRSRLWTLAHETLPALVNKLQVPDFKETPGETGSRGTQKKLF